MSATEVTARGATALRAFDIGFDESELTELRRRIEATRWPERETVADDSQGVPLATMQDLARYWATDYDWRRCEARLNALPNFLTEIDGLDIHPIHVRSRHDHALPLIVTHGWPGSIEEQLKIIEPLTIPRRTAAASPTPSTWSSPRCRGTGSPPSQTAPAGTRRGSHAHGPRGWTTSVTASS